MTSFLLIIAFSIFIISSHAGILPTGTQNDHKSRVLDLVSHHRFLFFLQDFEFFLQPLSQQEHFTDLNKDEKIEHNADYDHEAFLGVEESKKFDKLSIEESTKRLGYETKIKEELRIEIRTLCVLQKAKQNYRQIDFDRAVSKNRSAVSLYMSFLQFLKSVVGRKFLTLYIYPYNLASFCSP